jgi:isoquinoline 1-oxidoreductase beta subunit
MPLGIVKTADGFAWKYGGGQGVGGSTGLIGNWDLMRQVGADARRQLIRAAAERLGVDESQCHTRPGVVVCTSLDKEIAYSELVVAAAALPAPDDAAPLRAMNSYRIIGTSRKTIDALDIVTGKTKYGIDTIQPDMRYAVIARAPVLNARVKSFDDAGARAVDGVLDVFKIDGPAPGEPYFILASGIAVVATSTWEATVRLSSTTVTSTRR